MAVDIVEYAARAGIEREVLDEIVDKAVILVEGEALKAEVADITGLDNYYFWEEEKTIEDYLLELTSMSHGKRVREIYALLIGEKHVLSIKIEKGRITLVDIGKKDQLTYVSFQYSSHQHFYAYVNHIT